MSQSLIQLSQATLPEAPWVREAFERMTPLEKSNPKAGALLRRSAVATDYPEIDPRALRWTYRDACGLELPVFAAFSLEGPDHLEAHCSRHGSYELGPGQAVASPSNAAVMLLPSLRNFLEFDPHSPSNLLPWDNVCASLNGLPKRSPWLWAQAALGVLWLWFVPQGWAFAYAWLCEGRVPVGHHGDDFTVLALVAFCLLGMLTTPALPIAMIRSRFTKEAQYDSVRITAQFEGAIPERVRVRAREVKGKFKGLYLICDFQNRWQCRFLPAPRPAAFDPLLVGTRESPEGLRVYLIDRFDLTPMEKYLADEGTA